MKGCRPLDTREVREALDGFEGKTIKRDRAMFLVGTRAGFRISELLSIQVRDVCEKGHLLDRVTVRRKNMKGQTESRSVVLHPQAKKAVADLLEEMAAEGEVTPDTFLFRSRKGMNRPINREQAWRILRRAFEKKKITGRVATHSMRKYFAEQVYKKLNHDLVRTAAALGHKSITSTVAYIGFMEEDIDRAILGI